MIPRERAIKYVINTWMLSVDIPSDLILFQKEPTENVLQLCRQISIPCYSLTFAWLQWGWLSATNWCLNIDGTRQKIYARNK